MFLRKKKNIYIYIYIYKKDRLNFIIFLNNVMLYSCIEIILMYDYNNVILRCNVTS